MSNAAAKCHAGFTIIELLAVVLVVGGLGLILLPSWTDSLAESRTVRCASSLSAVGRAVQIHANDHNGQLPGCQHTPPSWVEALKPYISPSHFICPEEALDIANRAPRWTYALNDFLTAHPYGARDLNFSKLGMIPSPKQTLAFAEASLEFRAYDHFHFADARENGHTAERFAEQVEIERHSGAANYLLADGHVEGLAWNSAAKPKLIARGSRFVHPAGGPHGLDFARR